MTTYSSYEEAKISNPVSTIYKFNPLIGAKFTCAGVDTQGKLLQPANPADHCIRYDDFLTLGHRFVDGDAFLNSRGEVVIITNAQLYNRIIDGDEKRFVLRAAALEEKTNTESDYDKGMREAMKNIAKSCGRSFCVDIGYEDLPDLVESLINPKPEDKPKRTKVEYERVSGCIFDLEDDFNSGVLSKDEGGQ